MHLDLGSVRSLEHEAHPRRRRAQARRSTWRIQAHSGKTWGHNVEAVVGADQANTLSWCPRGFKSRRLRRMPHQPGAGGIPVSGRGRHGLLQPFPLPHALRRSPRFPARRKALTRRRCEAKKTFLVRPPERPAYPQTLRSEYRRPAPHRTAKRARALNRCRRTSRAAAGTGSAAGERAVASR